MTTSIAFENYFPLGLATGSAFLHRKESDYLVNNIQSHVHTLLMAPRRYGKSSLVLHTLEKNALHYIEIDLQLCRTAKTVEKKIIHGVEQLIGKTSKKQDSLLTLAKSFFQTSHKQWKISLSGFVELSIEPDKQDDVADNILTALQFLDTVLAKEKKNAVFFIDEVQEIQLLKESYELQGAIRHFAQKSLRCSFIFSGSNRRLLKAMFDDSTMPLYQLCDTMTLDKIDEKIYWQYLQKISRETFRKPLPQAVFDEIITLSHRHPRRLYHLCFYLWRSSFMQNKNILPTINDVKNAWHLLLHSSAKGVRYYLSQRNSSQLKILSYIASGHQVDLTGKIAQHATNLSSTAISKALQQLTDEDLIVAHNHHHYSILDPVVQGVLVTYERELT